MDSSFVLSDYLKYVKEVNVRQYVYRVDVINKDDDSVVESITDYVENGTGSITISNAQGARRSASITLRNYKNEFTDYFSQLTIGSRFKVYLGYRINGKDYLFPQGVFLYSNPQLDSNLSSKTVTISGVDKWSGLNGVNGGILNSTYQVPKDTSVGDFISRTLKLDIVRDYVPPNIDNDIWNDKTTYDIIHEAGETIADVILEVAFNLSCYAYYDENGVFTMRRFEYDIELPSIYDFTYHDKNYFTANKNYDIESLYNAVIVIGENTQDDKVPIIAKLENNDPSDPNSIVNGSVAKYYNVTEYTNGIDTQQKADERARYELKKVSAMQSTISISGASLYHLLENNIVTVSDSYLASNNERMLITGINFNIGSGGDMTLSLIKARNYL